MSKTQKASICYIFALLAFVGIRILSSYGLFRNFYGFVGDFILTFIMQITCLVIIPLAIYRLFSSESIKDTFKNFGYRKITKKTICYCLILGAIAFIINVGVSSVWNIFLYLVGYSSRGSGSSTHYATIFDLIISLISTAVFPAMCEEFLHRGLFQGLVKEDKGVIAPILTGILFGLYHLNIYQTGYAAILGIIMGLVAYYTKSIWPAVIMHFMNNAINVLLAFVSDMFPITEKVFDNFISILTGNYISLMITMVIIAIIFMLLIYFGFILFTKILKEEHFKESEITYIDIAGAFIVKDEDIVKRLNNNSIKGSVIDAKIEIKKMFPKINNKLDFKDYILLIVSIFLSVLITLFTLIWGLM